MAERMKNPIGWIDIPALDLDRAEAFYTAYFGFAFDRKPTSESGYTMSWFPMDMKSYGSGATLMHGESYVPSKTGMLMYFEAPEESIAVSLEKAKEQNVTVIMGSTSIGEHGFMAILEDSEGNAIAIHSMKE